MYFYSCNDFFIFCEPPSPKFLTLESLEINVINNLKPDLECHPFYIIILFIIYFVDLMPCYTASLLGGS